MIAIARHETSTGLPPLTRAALVALLRATPPAILAARLLAGDPERAGVATGYDLAGWWCSVVEDGGLIAFVRFDAATRRVGEAVCCARETREMAGDLAARLTALPARPTILYRGDYAEE